MEEARKRKLLGEQGYKTYRRIRYIRYLRKVRSQRRRETPRQPGPRPVPVIVSREKPRKRPLKERFYRLYRIIRFLNHRRQVVMAEKRRKRKLQRAQRREEKREFRQRMRKAYRREMAAPAQQAGSIKMSEEEQKTGKGPVRSPKERIYRLYRILRFLLRRWKKVRRQHALLMKKKRETDRSEKEEIRQRLLQLQASDRRHERELRLKQRSKKKQSMKRRLRLTRFVLRKGSRNLLIFFRTLTWKRVKDFLFRIPSVFLNREARSSFFIISLNSLSLYILSYLTIYVAGQLITIFGAFQFRYKTILYYYKIYYNIDSGDWFADAVKVLYSIPPLTGLFFGIIFLIIYHNVKQKAGLLKVFFLWGYIHGFTIFFSAVLWGTLLNKGFGYVITYLYYSDTGKMIFSILAIFFLFVVGLMSARPFQVSANCYYAFLDRSNRRFFMVSQVLVPAFLGTVLLILLKIPNNFYIGTKDLVVHESLMLLTVFLGILPIMATYANYNELFFEEEEKRVRLSRAGLILMIIVVLVFRIGLSKGIPFG
jgi:hypothetical protein